MSWLYGQTWLWYLIAFLVGVLLAWLFLVRPQQRRLRALQSRGAAPAPDATPGPAGDTPHGDTGDEDTAVLGSVPAAAAVGLGGAGLAAAAVAEHAAGSDRAAEPEPVTEQFPAVDPALSTLDTGTIKGGADDHTAPLVALGKADAPAPADDSPTETIATESGDQVGDVSGDADAAGELAGTSHDGHTPSTDDDPTTELAATPAATTAGPAAFAEATPPGDAGASTDGVAREDAGGDIPTDADATDDLTPPADPTPDDRGTGDPDTGPSAESDTTSPGGAGIAAGVAGAAGLTAAAVAGARDTDTPEPTTATAADTPDPAAATPTDTADPKDASDTDTPDGTDPSGTDTPDPAATSATDTTAPSPVSATTDGSAGAAGVAAGAGALGAAGLAAAHGSGPDPAGTPYGPGSARPASDGSAPGAEYTIKGNADSMLYHAPESPYYVRTRAEAWFTTAEAAEAAGFQPWHRNRKRAAVQGLVQAPTFEAGPYPGSAKPNEDGSAPTAAFMIKGNEDSMLYHLPTSPYYGRTKAEVWFIHESDAQAAGFTAWRRR